MCCFVSAIDIVVTAIAILNGHYTDICAIDSIDLECHKKDISFLSISTSLCMVILETCRSVDPYILANGNEGKCMSRGSHVGRSVSLFDDGSATNSTWLCSGRTCWLIQSYLG